VEIVVNPGGDDLSPGDDANLNQPGDDTITVVDTMSPTLAFENISEIKVTYIDDPDAGGDVPYGSLTYDPAQNAVTFAGLPDEKAIRIAYTAVVIGETGEAGEKVDISNTVEIAGYADSKTEVTQKFTVMDSSASGAGEKASFYVRKTDSTDDSALAGARFALYIEGEYTGWDDPILHPLPEGAAQTITEGEGPEAKTYYYLMSPGPTGADGKASFQDEGWIKQGDNYLLVEIEAPPGYIGLEEPLLLHISYEGEDTSTVPSGASLIANNGILTVTNEPGIRFPETGGGGAGPYAATGAAIMALALLLIGRRRRRPFDDGT
jgi:LPXTG-motif cell wall-anchored protein